MGAINARKSATLYDYLDAQDFYRNPVGKPFRSRMNVPFVLADTALDEAFLKGASQAGLIGLKGHRLVGGMRASLYNALQTRDYTVLQGILLVITATVVFANLIADLIYSVLDPRVRLS